MNDEARKIAQDIVIPWDENFHGRLALVDSIAAALVAAEERVYERLREHGLFQLADGTVATFADTILDDMGVVRKVLAQIDATERDIHDMRVEAGESLLILAAAESAARGEGKQ